ncbi:MAG: saccharopine dehydrogenase family protein [Anaerolineae bacterium]
MSHRYLVLGAGRQGTAAAYDIARFGEAERIILADIDPFVAGASAQRVNALVGHDVVATIGLDVSDGDAVTRALAQVDVCLSAVPYSYNLDLTRHAIAASAGLCDLGGNTAIIYQQLDLDAEAREAGVAIVPDCGMGPGMTNSLAAYAMTFLDDPREVYIWDGGLPQDPQPPWNYQLTFNIEGLTNEYDGEAMFLRDGQSTRVPCFTELEEIDVPPLGRLEAFVTAGGASTAVRTYAGQLQVYQNKTLRYPGHYAQFKAFRDLGLFAQDSVSVDGYSVTPRHFYHTLLEPHITAPDIRDVCVIRVKAIGMKAGRESVVTVDLIDYYDEETGFTAMERCTGWHAAIVAGMIARGEVRAGVVPLELAVPGPAFVVEARRRGFRITEEAQHTQA